MNDDQPKCRTYGWFKAMRSDDAIELFRLNPNALMLAYIIAYRARYREGFNADGLAVGDAILGHESCRMTEAQYKTAVSQLKKHGFATFRRTNRALIGRLIDTRLFDPTNVADNDQNNAQTTFKQRSNDDETTTNNNVNNVKEVKKGNSDATPSSSKDVTSQFLSQWYSMWKELDGYVKIDVDDEKIASRILASGIPPETFIAVAREARKLNRDQTVTGDKFWLAQAGNLEGMFKKFENIRDQVDALKNPPQPKRKRKPCAY